MCFCRKSCNFAHVKILKTYTLLFVLLLCACQKPIEKKQEVLRVTTEAASFGRVTGGRSYVGEIVAESCTPVSFTGTGTVVRVCVSEGQTVAKGQLVAELDTAQAQNAVRLAQAQVNQANDALARMKTLHDKGSLPDIKWVEVQSQVSQAQSSLAMAKRVLADCKVYAPVSGVVSLRTMEPGMTALPAQPICTIVDMTSLKVRVSVPEKEIAAITSTTQSLVTVAATRDAFSGGTVVKGVNADPLARTYDIKIAVPSSVKSLMPGMVCNVQLNAGGAYYGNALSVPLRCVQRASDGQQFVWVVKDGKAHRQNVILGEAVGDRIIIDSGLETGDEVIVAGYQKVSESSPVKS